MRGILSRREHGAAAILPIVAATVAIAGAAASGFAVQRVAFSEDGDVRPTLVEAGTALAYSCPGGPSVAEIHGGDRVFAIAVHDDLDGWLLIRNPIEPAERWWVEGRHIAADASTDELPAIGCADADGFDDESSDDPDEVAATDETTTTSLGDDDPDETTTTVVDGPHDGSPDTTAPVTPGSPTTRPPTATTRPGTPTTTTLPTTTTTAADTTRPTVSVSRSERHIWERYGPQPDLCASKGEIQSVITATATDAGGIKSVRVSWSVGGNNVNRAMSAAGQGNYTTTFGPYGYGTVASNTSQVVAVTVTVTDNAGNTRTGPTTVAVHSADECFG